MWGENKQLRGALAASPDAHGRRRAGRAALPVHGPSLHSTRVSRSRPVKLHVAAQNHRGRLVDTPKSPS